MERGVTIVDCANSQCNTSLENTLSISHTTYFQ
nr:MAG TPA: hypothetical protein [Caudoviricetes sp.]